MGRGGIVRKTFLFSAALIVLVMALSFGALYFVMPQYYRYQKEKTLRRNLDTLTRELKNTPESGAQAALIAHFVRENNVNVTSFAEDDVLVAELSSPFVSMQGKGESDTLYTIRILPAEGERTLVSSTAAVTMWMDSGGAGENIEYFSAVGAPSTAPGEAGGMHVKSVETRPIQVQASGVAVRGVTATRTSTNTIFLDAQVDTPGLTHLRVSGTLQPIDEAKEVLLRLGPYALLGGIAIALAFAWVYARRISKPILQISAATVKMRELEADAASGIRSDDELGQLSRNLDALYAHLRENIGVLREEMDKVARLEQAKTELMQSASHELKTPIAALGGMLEAMIDNVGVYQDKETYLLSCRNQVEKLSALVSEILDASRSDLPAQAAQWEPVRVDELVEAVWAEYEGEAAGLPVAVETVPLTVETGPSRLRRVVSNLIGNAVRYTPAGGRVDIRLTADALVIENDCDSLTEAEVPKLFEPFYTGSYHRGREKNGTGLGLYIVSQTLARLGIPYDAALVGGKLRVTLTFGEMA